MGYADQPNNHKNQTTISTAKKQPNEVILFFAIFTLPDGKYKIFP
tara:strand:- start:384728 stop:384862 length:135 start_codon:yes stop_codon:yes gene_type:complete